MAAGPNRRVRDCAACLCLLFPIQIKLAAITAALGVLGVVTSASAQTWPQRNVRFILPFGAGSATDISARMIGERVAVKWGRPVVVENRPGGDGLIAIGAFINANDDHVLLYASSATFLAHPYTQEKLPYDLERDLAPIVRVTDTVLSASVSASSPYKSMAEFIKAARAMPERYPAAGAAGLPEFALDAFLKSEKLSVTKIPYKDIVQAVPDLVGGRIQFLFSSIAIMKPMLDAGKVRVLATGGRQRSPLFKDIPSIVEAGYPSLAVETTAGIYGPKGMPLDLRRRIGADVMSVLSDPVFVERIASTGQDIRPGGPDELAAILKQQLVSTAATAKILGMVAKN